MSFNSKLTDLSREDLYSNISQLKRQINCLETDLIKTQLFIKSYEKYFDYFNEINERISSNDEILALIKRLKAIKHLNHNSLQCFVGVIKLTENNIKHSNIRQIKVFGKTNVESNDVWTQTEDNNLLFNTNFNFDNTLENESQNQINEEMVIKNEIFLGQNTNSSSKANNNSINSDLEDNNDSDFDVNDLLLSDNSDEEYIESQSKKKSSEGMFSCSYEKCTRTFISNRGLRVHEAMVHYKKGDTQSTQSQVYPCNFEGCAAVFPNKTRLLKHKTIHPKKFICSVDNCGQSTGYYTLLIQHRQKRHPKEMPFQCCLQECDNSFKTKELLREHQRNDHKFVCDHIGCGRDFKTQKDLREHKNTHSGYQYSCDWEDCHSVFKTKKSLGKHKLRHKNKLEGKPNKIYGTPSESKSRKCNFNDCEYVSKASHMRRHQLRKHPLEFDDIPWIKCEEIECKFETKIEYDFKRHMNDHRKPVQCPHCPSRFGRSRSLKRHMSVHLGAIYKCEWHRCDKSFTRKNIMLDHMNTHTGEKIYRCDWPGCEKTYLERRSLHIHRYRHTGKGYYVKCTLCDHRTTSVRIIAHMKTHENQSNEPKN